MASREELAHEFEVTRRELDEMAEEFAEIEERLVELIRQDIQVGETREWLDRVRERHAGLEAKYARVRAAFDEAIVDMPERTH